MNVGDEALAHETKQHSRQVSLGEDLHYELFLPGFPPAHWHGWWDTESSHSLRAVLVYKLTLLKGLQSFCALHLPSV